MEGKFVLIFYVTILIPLTRADEYEIIMTPLGKIKGIHVPLESGNVVQFRNIPYAKPPLGDLRFKRTVSVEPWEGTYDATSFGPSCVQDLDSIPAFKPLLPNHDLSEDCLALNIYVPNEVNNKNSQSVMVWIHGGGMMMGQGSIYDSSLLALGGDVIVVTINYRLGIFGFLSTGDPASPGNYGFWDQQMAFIWVKNNIAAFGGNSDSITIFGESAGSYSVLYQMLIPENRGLFQRAIAQSGSPIFNRFVENPEHYARLFAKKLNCTDDDSSGIETKALIECMRRVSWNSLLDVQNEVSYESYMSGDISVTPIFWPAYDGEMFRYNQIKALSENTDVKSFYQSVDLLAGTTDLEGNLLFYFLLPRQEKLGFNLTDGIPKSFCNQIASAIAEAILEKHPAAVKSLCDFYQSDNMEQNGRELVNLYGDAMFVAPVVKALNIHAKDNIGKNTFQYLFTTPDMTLSLFQLPPWIQAGSEHGADLSYLFGPSGFFNLSNPFENIERGKLFNMMIKYWTNFAKTGNPNGNGLPRWPQYDPEQRDFINLGFEVTQMKNLFPERMTMILDSIPKLLEKEKQRENRSEL